LLPAALLALSWQTTWVKNTPPALLLHKSCGSVILPELVCKACQRPVETHDVRYGPGPGAHRIVQENHRRRRVVAKAAHSDVLPVSDELLDILGDPWTPQVMALGFFGIRRFDDMLSALNVASNILTDRLKRLVEMGMLKQEVYQQRPARKEYRLTEKSRALYPLLVELTQWGDRWFSKPEGKPIRLEHIPCGCELEAQIICQNCKQVIAPGSTVACNV
jgi:DNA-binding HxlR family transcriptional regulator